MNKSTSPIIIFWFRKDLRLSDNPGFYHATELGQVLPIFTLDQSIKKNTPQAWWLYQSLEKLDNSLDQKLQIYDHDDIQTIINDLLKKHVVSHVIWNDLYEPKYQKMDTDLKKMLEQKNITVQTFCAHLLWKPDTIVKKDGTPYKVFTPFYQNGCLQGPDPRKPLTQPKKINFATPSSTIKNIAKILQDGYIRWNDQLKPLWNVGESAAQKKLHNFIQNGLDGYEEGRNLPGQKNISRLSPHLHFGELSPHQIWYAVQEKNVTQASRTDIACFLKELGWREFCHNLLYFFPKLSTDNFNSQFDPFPWKENNPALIAWQQGQTGYPIIDAGMRELAQTGFMHNRVRMIVASFLIKNLLIDWRTGQTWFENYLLDADLANNSANWQWVAGSGADAAPYFRIFNPVLQGEKFDELGTYTLRYVPELARLPKKYIHKPWTAPTNLLAELAIHLGKTYPHPIVPLDASRNAALAAYKNMK